MVLLEAILEADEDKVQHSSGLYMSKLSRNDLTSFLLLIQGIALPVHYFVMSPCMTDIFRFSTGAVSNHVFLLQVISSLAFFLFSYQVHEKSILLVAM